MSEFSNVINSTDAKRWVGEIEKLDEEILSIKMRNAAEQKAVKKRKKSCFERAEAAGLPMEALKLELFRRDQDRKRKERESDAGEDRVELADMIRTALGDFAALPLGQAAVETAEGGAAPKPKRGRPKKKGGVELAGEDDGSPPMTGADDDEPDLRSDSQKEKEALRKAEAEERLAGMKTLDESVTTH